MDDETTKFRVIGERMACVAKPVFFRQRSAGEELTLKQLHDDIEDAIVRLMDSLAAALATIDVDGVIAAAEELAKYTEDQQPKGKSARQTVLPDPRRSKGKGGKMRWRRE